MPRAAYPKTRKLSSTQGSRSRRTSSSSRTKRVKTARKSPLVLLINTLSTILFVGAGLIMFGHYSKSETNIKRLTITKPPAVALPNIKPEHRKAEWKWNRMYNQIKHRIDSKQKFDLVFYGDSLTQGWNNNGAWKFYYGNRKALNAGIWSDRTQHLLWRIQNGNLGTKKPKVAVVLIGGNNLMIESPRKVAGGVRQVIAAIHKRSPKTKILLVGLLPAGRDSSHPRRTKARVVNKYLESMKSSKVQYVDIGDKLLTSRGLLTKQVSFDGLHLTEFGYQIMAEALEPSVAKLLGQSPIAYQVGKKSSGTN